MYCVNVEKKKLKRERGGRVNEGVREGRREGGREEGRKEGERQSDK